MNSHKTSKHQFHSFLATHLATYLKFKQSFGYTSFGSGSVPLLARSFDHYLLFRGCSSIHQIDESLLANWIHTVSHRSAKTKNVYLMFVRKFFDYLLRIEVTKENPARRIPWLKTKPYRPYIYTLQEIQGILQQARSLHENEPSGLLGQTLATLLFLLYACALRISEALKLKIQDVDFQENTLSLWKTKFHKERLVPFSKETASKLKDYLVLRQKAFPQSDPKAPFFVHKGKSLSYYTVRDHFRTFLAGIGLAHLRGRGHTRPRLHDFRHTAAVHRLYKWYQEGYDILNKLPILSTYLGHTDIAHTQVYLTISQFLIREGDRRFQATFENLTKKTIQRAFHKS